MPGIKVLIRHKGPMLEGDPRAVIRRQLRSAKDAVGEQLVRDVQAQLNRVLKVQTPYYRTQIDYLINQGNGAVVVHDRGVVYGPWLEGTGSRNATTRFKGYRTFRTITQRTQAQVAELTQDHITVAVRELS